VFTKVYLKLFFKTLAASLMTFLIFITVFNCGKKDISSAEDILDEINISRGICVLFGDLNGEKAIELAEKSDLIIYIQLQNDKEVEAARQAIDEAGFYGTRIFVKKGSPEKTHLADNIADALIAVGEAAKIPKSEALRVLCPRGKAIIGRNKYIKPFPEGIDDWSHPYHGPDNNPQSNDKIARAPYLTQFIQQDVFLEH